MCILVNEADSSFDLPVRGCANRKLHAVVPAGGGGDKALLLEGVGWPGHVFHFECLHATLEGNKTVIWHLGLPVLRHFETALLYPRSHPRYIISGRLLLIDILF
jgi:hypothetical protein